MAFKVPKIPVCVAMACCVVALIFQLVAVAGTGWCVGVTQSLYKEIRYEVGLFRVCSDGLCVELQNNSFPDWWKVCQAFSILGLLTIAGSLVTGILHAVIEETAKFSLAGIASCAASVVFLIIEVAVFGAKLPERFKGFDFGYGFILSIIACILSVISAVLFAVGSRL